MYSDSFVERGTIDTIDSFSIVGTLHNQIH